MEFTALQKKAEEIHEKNKKWWLDENKVYAPEKRCVYQAAILMQSELAEMTEAIRKNLKSEKIPEYSNEVEELADFVIRILDFAGGKNQDLTMQINDDLIIEDSLIAFKEMTLSFDFSAILADVISKPCWIATLHELTCHLTTATPVVFFEEGQKEDFRSTIKQMLFYAFAYAEEYRLPLLGAIDAKMEYNLNRPDHKLENRAKEGGKKW